MTAAEDILDRAAAAALALAADRPWTQITLRDIALKAGQFSMHQANLVHGSEPNVSPRRRAGLVLRYMPATSLFDRSDADHLAAVGVMKTGDILIQRGTNHAWANRSDAPCRIAFVLLDAER